MIVFYDSLTGQGKRFAKRLGYEIRDVSELDLNNVPEKMLLVTRSWDFGKVPETTLDFLDDLQDYGYLNRLVGTAITGNKNWGQNYGKSGDTIQEDYNVPLILKFESSGFPSDIKFMKEYLSK